MVALEELIVGVAPKILNSYVESGINWHVLLNLFYFLG